MQFGICIPRQFDVPRHHDLFCHCRLSGQAKPCGDDTLIHQSGRCYGFIIRELDHHTVNGLHILKGFDEHAGRLYCLQAIAERHGFVSTHIIHFSKFFAFCIPTDGANGVKMNRQCFALLYDIFYLTFGMNGRAGIGDEENMCEPAGGRCGCTCFQALLVLKTRITKMRKEINPPRRDHQIGNVNRFRISSFNVVIDGIDDAINN